MTETPGLPEGFLDALQCALAASAQGLSEYELIGQLREQGYLEFLPDSPIPPHLLFRAHFIVFHGLYRLRDRLLLQQQAVLEIHTLCIRLRDWVRGGEGIGPADPLREYYMDWANMEDTTPDDVEAMLNAVWQRIGRQQEREQALAELGLADPVSDETIRRTWRRLAMQHHPDRGGDKDRIQAINVAVGLLLD